MSKHYCRQIIPTEYLVEMAQTQLEFLWLGMGQNRLQISKNLSWHKSGWTKSTKIKKNGKRMCVGILTITVRRRKMMKAWQMLITRNLDCGSWVQVLVANLTPDLINSCPLLNPVRYEFSYLVESAVDPLPPTCLSLKHVKDTGIILPHNLCTGIHSPWDFLAGARSSFSVHAFTGIGTLTFWIFCRSLQDRSKLSRAHWNQTIEMRSQKYGSVTYYKTCDPKLPYLV